MAVPAQSRPGVRPDWCYISLGTWALMGIESPRPVVNDSVLQLNFTNEGGVGGTIRLLKNITGLWLVQECRRVWNHAGANLDWEALNRLSHRRRAAAVVRQSRCGRFLAPRRHARGHPRVLPQDRASPCPRTRAACCEPLWRAWRMKFRQVLGMCEELAGGRIETIHIVGGGTKNRQLCQFAADACNRRVVAGPVEATAIGNLMMQAVAAGDVASIAEAREVIRRSFPVDEYRPEKHGRVG